MHIVNDATIGGAQTFLLSLSHGWPTPDDELHLIVLRGREVLSPRYTEAFFSVCYLDAARRPIMAARLLRSRLRELKPDVVHSHLLQSDLVNLILTPRGSRRYTTVHTTGLSHTDPILSRLIARAVGRLSARFTAVVACNETCLRFAESMDYRAQIQVIENGTDLPDEWNYDAAATSFVSLARLHPMKGQDVLLAAFAKVADELPGWNLICLGQGVGPTAPSLQAVLNDPFVRQLLSEGRIRLEGATQEPGQHLKQAAALVISSTYGEASPMVAIEATGLGVPVVATKVGGAPSFVADGVPVASPGSVESLAGALWSFAHMTKAERSAASQWSRAQALARFDVRARARDYRSLYEANTDRSSDRWSR